MICVGADPHLRFRYMTVGDAGGVILHHRRIASTGEALEAFF